MLVLCPMPYAGRYVGICWWLLVLVVCSIPWQWFGEGGSSHSQCNVGPGRVLSPLTRILCSIPTTFSTQHPSHPLSLIENLFGNTTSKNVSLQIFPQSLFLVRHDDYDYRELETLLPPLLRYFSSKNVTKYQILLRECNQAIEISTSGSSSRCVVVQRQGQESLQQSASLPTSWTTQQRWFSFPIFPPIFLANKFNYSTKVIFPNWTTEQR